MNLALAAQSGWGKSAKGQQVMEANIPDYDRVVVLDFKDEYRGLCKADMAKYWVAGSNELAWGSEQWEQFLNANEKVVLARRDTMEVEDWQALCDTVVGVARRLSGSVLIVIDEAHFVVPQVGATPSNLKGLATTGRGEKASSIWITQRLAEVEETVLAQCQARLLGGFESDADLSKVGKLTEYPDELHNPQAGRLSSMIDPALADDGAQIKETKDGDEVAVNVHALRVFENEDGDTIGSEWIYSDNSGDRDRIDTRGMFDSMESVHYSPQGEKIQVK